MTYIKLKSVFQSLPFHGIRFPFSMFIRSKAACFHLMVIFDICSQLSGSLLLTAFLLSSETSTVSSFVPQDVIFLLFLQLITSLQSILLCQQPTSGYLPDAIQLYRFSLTSQGTQRQNLFRIFSFY